MNTQKRSTHKNTAVSVQRNRQGDENSTLIKILKGALLSLLITFIISFALLLIGAAVAYSNPDPDRLISPISYVSLYTSSLLGGFCCAKLSQSNRYPVTALTAALFALIGFLMSLFMPDNTYGAYLPTYLSLILRLATIPLFFVGSAVAHSRPKRSRSKRRGK